jgi:tetratricopeptide (TPR) repeat protein
MRTAIAISILAAVALGAADRPVFDDKGELRLPADYREWIYLSSGLGMTYGPNAAQAMENPFFDNVYVNPPAFAEFKKTGKWPDGTIFVLEIRYSTSQGSINKGGYYQTDSAAIEAAVKDSSRFEKGWGYFNFRGGMNPQLSSAPALSRNAGCYACHEGAGAVENTFTQFYPTALAIAQAKGTVKASYQAPPPSPVGLLHSVRENKQAPASLLAGVKEPVMNQIGYALLQSGEKAQAISIFELTAANYPKSANAQDSLSEALEAAGKPAEARVATERGLALLEADTTTAPALRDRIRKGLNDRLARLK